MATKGECCCSDGPVGIVRGLGEAGVPLEKAVHLCELYYAVQYRDGAGKVPRRLDLVGLHEQAFGNQIEAGRVLGSCGSGSGKDVGGGEGSASLDGSRGGAGERGWNGGGSLVSPSESGSRGREVVYFGGARGPNYLRNQKDRMRKAMAKRERIEREAENRGRIAALKVVAQKGELTEDEKLLKHLKVKRMLAAEEKRLSETGSPSLVFDSALRQLMKAGDLADGGADEKVKKWVQKLMSAGSPEWLQADKVDGFSDADSGDSSGGGVPSGRSDVEKGDGKRRKGGKARASSSRESTPPETVVDMSNLAPNVTSVEMSGGGIRIVHHGKFVRFVDSSGTSTNSAGVPYNKVSAMDYIKKHSYMQAVNYPNMGFSDYVRHNKMNYNTACMYNYLIDEFKLDVVKLGHAVGKIEKTKK